MDSFPVPRPANAIRPSPNATFLAILPIIERHGRVCFRHVRCRSRQEEAVAEMIALAWKWHLRLTERGKDARRFPTALAAYAARAVNDGRRLCGKERAKDVLSPPAQRHHGFTTSPLPEGSTLSGNVFDEALQDNTRSPVPEQVSFRIDFPQWLGTFTERDRCMIEDLMAGEGTFAVSRKYGLSPGRISQKRREFMEDWQRFGEAAEMPPGGIAGSLVH